MLNSLALPFTVRMLLHYKPRGILQVCLVFAGVLTMRKKNQSYKMKILVLRRERDCYCFVTCREGVPFLVGGFKGTQILGHALSRA